MGWICLEGKYLGALIASQLRNDQSLPRVKRDEINREKIEENKSWRGRQTKNGNANFVNEEKIRLTWEIRIYDSKREQKGYGFKKLSLQKFSY